MYCKTVSILLRIGVRGHFVMSITKNHESHYVTVVDNPHWRTQVYLTIVGSKPLITKDLQPWIQEVDMETASTS